MSEEAERKKRPDFVGGVQVKAPEDYDFSNEGTPFSSQGVISPSTAKISNYGQTQFGRRDN
jgi:hypothetical protein